MKRIILILLTLICTYSFAIAQEELPIEEPTPDWYVYIKAKGRPVAADEETARFAIGDIVEICPKTPQYYPTQGELARYKVIIITGCTWGDIESYQESLYDITDPNTLKKLRKYFITDKNLKKINQLDEYEASVIKNYIDNKLDL